jgi:cysteine desulfurase
MDHNATTPCDPRVVEAMLPWFTDHFGNPSERHHAFGWEAAEAVDDARRRVAAIINARPAEVVFTSGATESNNLALKGAVRGRGRRRPHVITQPTEHESVLAPLRTLQREGLRVTQVPVDSRGLVDPSEVAGAIQPDTVLVSIMAANNEVGTIQPVAEIGALCRERKVLFHVDAAQAIGKLPIDVRAEGIDLLSASAHKIYGPKGIGLLYIRRAAPPFGIEPLLDGGGHERGLRSGTLNVPGVLGMARALEICSEDRDAENQRLAALRERLWQGLARDLDGLHRNDQPDHGLAGLLHVSIDGLEADALLVSLRGVALAAGSACTSEREGVSHVLHAMGLSEARALGSLRFGLGRGNTAEEVDRVAEMVIDAVRRLRQLPR